jgi:hypothetical protein
MIVKSRIAFIAMLLTAGGLLSWASVPAADTSMGEFSAATIMSSTFTLWAASAGARTQHHKA